MHPTKLAVCLLDVFHRSILSFWSVTCSAFAFAVAYIGHFQIRVVVSLDVCFHHDACSLGVWYEKTPSRRRIVASDGDVSNSQTALPRQKVLERVGKACDALSWKEVLRKADM